MSKGKMFLFAGATLLAGSGVAGLVDRYKRKTDPRLLNLKMLKMALAKFIDTFEVVESDVKDRRIRERKANIFENRYLDKNSIQKSYDQCSSLVALQSRFNNNQFSVEEKNELTIFFERYMEHNPEKNTSSAIITYIVDSFMENINVTYDLYTISKDLNQEHASLTKHLSLFDLDTKYPNTKISKFKDASSLEELVLVKNPVDAQELLPLSSFLNANQAFSKIEELLYFLEKCSAKKATINISESLKSSVDIFFKVNHEKDSKVKEDSEDSQVNESDLDFRQNSVIKEKSNYLYEVTWAKPKVNLNQDDRKKLFNTLRHLKSDTESAYLIKSLLEGNQIKEFNNEIDIDLKEVIKLNISANLFARNKILNRLKQTAEVNLDRANHQNTSFKLKVEFY